MVAMLRMSTNGLSGLKNNILRIADEQKLLSRQLGDVIQNCELSWTGETISVILEALRKSHAQDEDKIQSLNNLADCIDAVIDFMMLADSEIVSELKS